MQIVKQTVDNKKLYMKYKKQTLDNFIETLKEKLDVNHILKSIS